MDGKLNRRQAIGGGISLGLGLVMSGLAGCAGKARWQPLTQDDLDGPPRQPLAPPREPYRSDAVPPVGIVSRREWTTALPTLAFTNPMGPVSRITVHHDGMSPVPLRSKSESAARLEFIRRAHANRGWADIGYHFAIDPQGRVWECRPAHLQGAHVRDHNEQNLGIVVLGNFDEQTPTSAALTALDHFVADRMRAYRVPVSRVLTHQEISPTACPGRSLQGYMVAARSGRGSMIGA